MHPMRKSHSDHGFSFDYRSLGRHGFDNPFSRCKMYGALVTRQQEGACGLMAGMGGPPKKDPEFKVKTPVNLKESQLPQELAEASKLLQGEADGIMTNWQLANACLELAKIAEEQDSGLAMMFHQMALTIVVNYGMNLLAKENNRIRETNLRHDKDEGKVMRYMALRETKRKQGKIVHYLNGGHKPIIHGYHGIKSDKCVYCAEESNPSN